MSVEDVAALPDLTSGDQSGNTADTVRKAWTSEWFRSRRCSGTVNDPHHGGDLVRRCGALTEQRQSIQVEVKRALHIDKADLKRGARVGKIGAACGDLVAALVAQSSRKDV